MTLIIDSFSRINELFNDNVEEFTNFQYINGKSNTNIIIERSFDKFNISYLEFEENIDTNDIHMFEIRVGNIVLWSFNFEILKKICKFKKNRLYFPENFFTKKKEFIPIVSCNYNDIIIKLTSKYDIDFKIYLTVQILNIEKRDMTLIIPQKIHINTYKEKNIDSKKITVRDLTSISGFYIITSKINSLKLKGNEFYQYFTHNHNSIKYYGSVKKTWSNKINIINKLPFCYDIINNIKSFLDNEYLYFVPISLNNYHVDTTRYDSNTLFLEFDKEYSGKIIIVGRNILQFSGGVCGLVLND
jgi:hypothetical protein